MANNMIAKRIESDAVHRPTSQPAFSMDLHTYTWRLLRRAMALLAIPWNGHTKTVAVSNRSIIVQYDAHFTPNHSLVTIFLILYLC